MALISCTECGKEISDKAVSCTNCGAPVSGSSSMLDTKSHSTVTRAGTAWEAVGFLLVVVGMITAMATGPDNHIGGIMFTAGFIVFIVGRFK